MRSLNFRRSKRQRKLYGVPTSIVGLFLVLIVLFVFLTVISYLTSELPGKTGSAGRLVKYMVVAFLHYDGHSSRLKIAT